MRIKEEIRPYLRYTRTLTIINHKQHYMRNLNALFLLFALSGMLIFTSCGDDPVVDVDPTLSLTSGSEFDGAVLNGGDTISLALRGIGGTDPLNAVTFFEDGVRLEGWEDRLWINDQPASSSAPLLTGTEKDQFTWTVDILADTVEGSHELVIEVVDEAQTTASVTINYTTIGVDTLMGVLFNSGGPAGTGGLDLDEGIGTGSNDDRAEIRDLGINGQGLPTNWRQQIAPANDAVLATVNSEIIFDDVWTSTDLTDAFDETNEISETERIEGGEVFAIKRGEDYYLIRIVEVNVVPTDNSDNYVIDIRRIKS